ncbi:MAG: AsnC family transcriptional regulator [Flavobacterium sp.]|mgnify:CR=1 FL=1|uniref:Lrp/AsnC family transcriptional regulator n=1 Tax=unclassified Flavobacterium TaxID=196869 RepID=UPI000C596885|nr:MULTISPECIES: Lrp/AsnC family transcriptional regulator [unclassified Flavobacterium]MBF04323.1 AsnC family transcriptional regulator [Flavobacterium sp.]MCO6163206.1 Lrp/AsnC family transcriptional regulator [Flavobacterium sp. NRK F7]|tara:strand:- start:365 stop:841 length:477 start_codon:yes stop_codon:yes gene_type:complete
MRDQLDAKDQLILEILQNDSTISVKDIGEKIGLSFTPTYERIKNLERNGVIKKYVALLDRFKIGVEIVVYCNVTLKEQSKEALDEFERIITPIPQVLDVISLSGNYDYMLKIVANDIRSYNDFVVNVISNIPNIGQYHSSIVMNECKKETAYPFGIKE